MYYYLLNTSLPNSHSSTLHWNVYSSFSSNFLNCSCFSEFSNWIRPNSSSFQLQYKKNSTDNFLHKPQYKIPGLLRFTHLVEKDTFCWKYTFCWKIITRPPSLPHLHDRHHYPSICFHQLTPSSQIIPILLSSFTDLV